MADEKLLTSGEVAHMISRSAETVREYERQGRISAIRTNRGQRLFRESDAMQLAEKLNRRIAD